MRTVFRIIFFVLIFITQICQGHAQTFVAYSGFSIDLNNTKPFYHVPVILQWHPGKTTKTSGIIEIAYNFSLKRHGSGAAYTLNPNLPERVQLQEKVTSQMMSITGGVAIFTGKISGKPLSLNIQSGYAYQRFKVDYPGYDHTNYELLNPDAELKKGSVVFSFATTYALSQSENSPTLMLQVQTPLIAGRGSYPLSFKYAAPLRLCFGYTFPYKR